MKTSTAAALVLAACLTGCATAEVEGTAGYLSDAALTRLAEAVPPMPDAGSQAERADLTASQGWRVMEHTDRWTLSTAHADLSPPGAVRHFDAALGFHLSDQDTPHLDALMRRLMQDADAAAEQVKARAHRPRPVAVDPARASCQTIGAAQRASPSYPSGSAAVGGAYGALFAALVPERAEQARDVGHQIAASRMICGMHYPADVAAGERLGWAVFVAASREPAFRVDLAAARAEMLAAQDVSPVTASLR